MVRFAIDFDLSRGEVSKARGFLAGQSALVECCRDSGLSSNLEHEAIREAKGWTRDEVSESGLDDVGVLEDGRSPRRSTKRERSQRL